MENHRKEKQESIDSVLKEFDSYLKAIRISMKSLLPHKRESLEFIRERIIFYSKQVAEGKIEAETVREIVMHIIKNG